MDHCVTAAGRRKLRAWLCQPLACPQAIWARQDAVQDLMEGCCEAAGAARRQFAGQHASTVCAHMLLYLPEVHKRAAAELPALPDATVQISLLDTDCEFEHES